MGYSEDPAPSNAARPVPAICPPKTRSIRLAHIHKIRCLELPVPVCQVTMTVTTFRHDIAMSDIENIELIRGWTGIHFAYLIRTG